MPNFVALGQTLWDWVGGLKNRRRARPRLLGVGCAWSPRNMLLPAHVISPNLVKPCSRR